MTARRIAKVVLAAEKAEGLGARVRRSIGTPNLRKLSPFLMLDHFSVAPGAGFPDHPHTGMETITYLLRGAVDHEDFNGGKGTIEAGDLQFMSSGKGIMHSEMPHPNPNGDPAVGIQLWVDLPQNLRQVEPRYRDLRGKDIPIYKDDKVEVKVISGNSHGVDSVKDLAYTPVWMLDLTIQPGGSISQEIPTLWNSFAYIIDGTATVDETEVAQYHNVVFTREGDLVEVSNSADTPLRLVLIAGQVLDQQTVQYGPFVSDSAEGISQAMVNFQSYSHGFEKGRGWKSEIGKSLTG